jgi:hypothetical protein
MGDFMRPQWVRLVIGTLLTALFVLSSPAAPAEARASSELCHLKLSNDHMPSVAVQRGVVFHREYLIDLKHCTFRIVNESRHAISRPLDSPEGGTLTSVSQHFGNRLSGNDPNVFEREETWDTYGGGFFETTYVEDRQTYSSDGANAYVSFLQTLTWERNDGWFITAGPSQWFNTPNPNSSVSTESYGAFNNTTFPCSCQPCDHQLWAELRSYADGTWTHSSAFTGDPGTTICSGWVHVQENYGSW